LGCRQTHEIPGREDIIINNKRTEKLYREEGLQLLIRSGKKTAASLKFSRLILLHHKPQAGRWHKVQAVDYSDRLRFACNIVDSLINNTRSFQVLDRLYRKKGLPEIKRVGFAVKIIEKWMWRI
jgi:hypothetical protein